MLKLREEGLFTTSKEKDSAFAGIKLGNHNQNDGANFLRNLMTIQVATNPGAAETIGIGTKTYTFVVSGATGDQINIGGTIAETVVNIITKINEDSSATGVTAYPLGDVSKVVLVANELSLTPPVFVEDGVKIIEDIAWDVTVAEALLEDEDYFKVPLTDPNSKPIVLVERNSGTYQNFLY